MTGRLDGRVAVVTGAATGIGRAIAARFGREGARLLLVDRDAGPAGGVEGDVPTEDLVRAAGGEAETLRIDLLASGAATEVLERAAAPTGRVDVVVNNAGRFGGAALLDTSDAEWDEYLDVNLRTQMLMCRAAIAVMRRQDEVDGVRGRIVNMSSQLGLAAPPHAVGYAVAKAGVAQLTRQLAVDYARDGIVVNALAPGRIITGTHPGEAAYLSDGTIDEATAYSLSRTPFPRLGRPDDVAGAALFLSSDDCTFVSGHVLAVDGGWLAS
jgi:NAD(P)-dependent dehydrogenase (short-subunit alcohol dehydrogenase family)